MTPLQAALSLAEVDDVAVGVGEHLHLDVPRAFDQSLDQQRAVAERTLCLTLCGCNLGSEIVVGRDHTHALATATGRRLDEHWKPDAQCLRGQLRIVQPDPGDSWDHAHAASLDRRLGADLVAHRLDRLDRWPDENDPGVRTGRGECTVLGQEPVAGVQRLRARRDRSLDDPLDREVALRGRGRAETPGNVGVGDVPGVHVGIAVDRDGADAHRPQRADDADRDLSAIGDEHSVEHGRIKHRPDHILNTP